MTIPRGEEVPTRLDALIPAVLERTSQPVWVVGGDGRVLYANPASLHALGYARLEEVIGGQSHALLHPTHPDGSPYPQEECRMLGPAIQGIAVSGEDWFIRSDGTYFPIEWASAPIELTDGRGVIHSFTDTTVRKQLERASRERELAEMREAELSAAHLRLMENVASARRQIAHDLHDGAQQRLVALALGSRMLRELTVDSHDAALGLIDGLMSDAQAAIDELRDLVAGVHPPVLTSHGLLAAVRSLADRAPLPVVVSGDLGDRRLEPLIESNLYFLTAEAVTNAVKYSGGGSVKVRIDLADQLELVVSDDGVGGVAFERAGTGLNSMRDRITALQGEFRVASPRGEGTEIVVRLPISS